MARPHTDDVFRAISDPTRRGILNRLALRQEAMGQLAAEFDMSLPAVSQHLRVLREVGLVKETRVGRERHYRIEPKPLREVVDWIAHFNRFWNDKLDALERHLQEHPPKTIKETR